MTLILPAGFYFTIYFKGQNDEVEFSTRDLKQPRERDETLPCTELSLDDLSAFLASQKPNWGVLRSDFQLEDFRGVVDTEKLWQDRLRRHLNKGHNHYECQLLERVQGVSGPSTPGCDGGRAPDGARVSTPQSPDRTMTDEHIGSPRSDHKDPDHSGQDELRALGPTDLSTSKPECGEDEPQPSKDGLIDGPADCLDPSGQDESMHLNKEGSNLSKPGDQVDDSESRGPLCGSVSTQRPAERAIADDGHTVEDLTANQSEPLESIRRRENTAPTQLEAEHRPVSKKPKTNNDGDNQCNELHLRELAHRSLSREPVPQGAAGPPRPVQVRYPWHEDSNYNPWRAEHASKETRVFNPPGANARADASNNLAAFIPTPSASSHGSVSSAGAPTTSGKIEKKRKRETHDPDDSGSCDGYGAPPEDEDDGYEPRDEDPGDLTERRDVDPYNLGLLGGLKDSVFEHWDEQRLKDCEEFFNWSHEKDISPPKPCWLRRAPFPHQLYSSYFMLENEITHDSSTLLADEMGLGKTGTVITAIVMAAYIHRSQVAHAKCSETICSCLKIDKAHYPVCTKSSRAPAAYGWKIRNLPTLILVPANALDTWTYEFHKFASKFSVVVERFHGTKSSAYDLAQLRRQSKKPDHERKCICNVILLTTTQSLNTKLSGRMQGLRDGDNSAKRISFARVVVDEAHRIHGTGTQHAKSMFEIVSIGAKFWPLTGTPLPRGPVSVELMLKLFSTSDIKDKRQRDKFNKSSENIRKKFDALVRRSERLNVPDPKASEEQTEALRLQTKTEMEEGAQEFVNLILSRTIKRVEESRLVGAALRLVPPMAEEERNLGFVSRKWRYRYEESYRQRQTELTVRNQELREVGAKVSPNTFIMLRKDRIYAGIPGLMDYEDYLLVDNVHDELQGRSSIFTPSVVRSLYKSSAKLRFLVQLCQSLDISKTPSLPDEGNKLVVFCNTPIEAYIVYRTLAWLAQLPTLLMHSGLKIHQRYEMVEEEFQGLDNKPKGNIIVGTLALLGEVYTITKARTAVIFSPDWVNTNERQAERRIRRIGQVHPTRRIRFIAQGTIDALIVRRQEHRVGFDDRVFGCFDANQTDLSLEDRMDALHAGGTHGPARTGPQVDDDEDDYHDVRDYEVVSDNQIEPDMLDAGV